ncbi:MAG: hypothetical protein U1F98_12160 [Verrucomicrobiota bacterium]
MKKTLLIAALLILSLLKMEAGAISLADTGPAIFKLTAYAQDYLDRTISVRTNRNLATTTTTVIASRITNAPIDSAFMLALVKNSFNTNLPRGAQLVMGNGEGGISFFATDASGSNILLDVTRVLSIAATASISSRVETRIERPALAGARHLGGATGSDLEFATLTYDDSGLATQDGTHSRFQLSGMAVDTVVSAVRTAKSKESFTLHGAGTGTIQGKTNILLKGTVTGLVGIVTRSNVSPPDIVMPSVIASNLNGAGTLVIEGNTLYFTDDTTTDGIVKSVAKTGGAVSTLLTGLQTYESRIADLFVTNGIIYGGYGGYNGYNIVSAPVSGGAVTPIVSTTGGYMFGVSGSLIYYGSGFSYINCVTTSGANPTKLASGNWVRGFALDANALYFSDYFSKDVRKYDFSSGTITPLITGYTADAAVLVDTINLYSSVNGIIQVVPKTGGKVTTLVSSGTARAYASDGTHLFYVDNNAIMSIPVTGGPPQPWPTSRQAA